jgi:hypothetical protein
MEGLGWVGWITEKVGEAAIGLRKPLVREPQIPLTSQTDETTVGLIGRFLNVPTL